MKKMNNATACLVVSMIIVATGCQGDFLDIKQDRRQVMPNTIEDLQAILDNTTVMNILSVHILNSLGADEYYISNERWNLLASPEEKNGYVWATEIYEGQHSRDWNNGYKTVLYANMALDGIDRIAPVAEELDDWRNVKGSALFYRALAFYQLLQTFAKPYDPVTANVDLGIPLRLEPDINMVSTRSSVEQAFRQIVADLKAGLQLLPPVALVKHRPSKPAAHALLARAYLQMGKYAEAGLHADSCIMGSKGLLNYNDIDVNARYPFPANFIENPEIVYFSSMPGITILNSQRFNLDTNLYHLYSDGDLRKEAFFYDNNGLTQFKGSYRGAYTFFTGLAVDEAMLIRAECYVRVGNIEAALADLNALVENRYRPADFVPFVSNDPTTVLGEILAERRRQLLLRGLRWEDLRRLNKEQDWATAVTRNVNGVAHILPPNSNRYVWPIPDNVIRQSGIPQNPRE